MTIKRHQREELEKLSKGELVDYVMQLEEIVTRDSSNSSKPPSKDDAPGREKRKDKKKKRNTSLRKSGQRKAGGQDGHPGSTLQASENPDLEVDLPLDKCPHCQGGLGGRNLTGGSIRRQVFDLPEPRPLECTQYNSLEYQCEKCGRLAHADFPEGVSAPVQYGSRLGAWLVYMKDELLLPYKRIETFFRDLLDAPISPATIERARTRACENLESWEKNLIRKLMEEDVLGADESGLRIMQETYWLHVASTGSLTYYGVHKKRGKEAMDAFGILPGVRGRMIHDYLQAYLRYNKCLHGLCNQHHLRDLEAVGEMDGQSWAPLMGQQLRGMLHSRHQHEANGTLPDQVEIRRWQLEYQDILKIAEAENPLEPEPEPPPDGKKKRGRPKKGKARNLYERFRDRREMILAFFTDFRVPFTNNQAERDIRMIKVQQKVSGCFRTERGAKKFARIKSYLSTMRKQKRNLFEALKSALEGSPQKLRRSSHTKTKPSQPLGSVTAT